MTPAGEGPRVAVQEWPGSGTPILAVHATGFCKETWAPVVEELRAAGLDNPVTALDQRAHGDSPRCSRPYDWWDLGGDAAVVAAALPGGGRIGMGHSSGAAALVMAELLVPGSFSALVLVEPIIFPGPFRRLEHNPMSTAAERRRPSFPSPEAAFENFRGKRPFAGWEERALRAYVSGGLAPVDGAWVLKCRPEDEADFYRAATAHGAWERLGEVGVPVVLVAGESSDTHNEDFLAASAAQFRNATTVVVDGASHFVPMERPAALAAVLVEMLRGGTPAGRR